MQFLQRYIYKELKTHLASPEISLILGPRQAGKTTLMHHLKEDVEKTAKPAIYLNLDITEDMQYFTSQHSLLEKIKSEVGKNTSVVFIDEIQRLKNAGLFLKGLYDLTSGHKFIVSGSGSLELKADIIEPMTGRKKTFYCMPLSFTEYTANKLGIDFSRVTEKLEINSLERSRIIKEYFTFGGYPRVILSEKQKEKIDILSEIYKSYLEKDIQLLMGVEKEIAFENLVRILASQVGNIINRAELSSTLGITEKTIEKYLYLLEKTYVISLVPPFFRNARKEVRKSPKVYFRDIGFLQLARGKINPAQIIEGNIFENSCFLRLSELELIDRIKFWRTTSGAEIDFIIVSPNTGEIIPVEIKMNISNPNSLGKSLLSFINKYRTKNVFLINLEKKLELERNKANIHIIPYHKLPILNSPGQYRNSAS